MRNRKVQFVLTLSCFLLAVTASAGTSGTGRKGPWADADHVMYTPACGSPFGNLLNKANVTLHGGPVMTSPARLVFLFWGPSFCVGGVDRTYATTLQAYRNQLGGTPVWAVLQEYNVPPTNLGLGTPDSFDCSTPPTNVTDSAVRSKVNAYLASHTFDPNSIYEVVIPSTSYSSSGTSTSCGGPSLAYCSYHSWIGSGTNATKYTIQPYPSCAGCKVSGFSNVQNQEIFVFHETVETVTDPTGLGWYDSSGLEIMDKCAWSPAPFLSGGYAYQYVWSNRRGKCVNAP